jgi:hypothetical protein
VLWPRESTGCAETASPEFPVVLLEVQMHLDPCFHHRLAAQTYWLLQKHRRIEHLEVVVITPHQRHVRVFLDEVHWISLEAVCHQPDLDPLLNLLVRPEAELPACSLKNG